MAKLSVGNLARGWAGLATALLLAPAAGALSITGVSIATTGLNTSGFTGTGNNRFEVASSTSYTTLSSTSFESRYASLVAQDREGGSATTAQTATSDYTITFTVDNPTGATYKLDITTLRMGALTLVSDDAGNATTQIDAVTGTLDAVVDGTLGLAAFGPLAGSTGGTLPFNQSGTYSSATTYTDLSRTFVLGFNWTSSATSTRDEAAIRMGLDGNLVLSGGGGGTDTTADNYSLDGRNIASDGHFVTVTSTLISTPEPAPGALVAFGVLGLAIRARRAGIHRR